MRKFRTWLTTMAVLLGSITQIQAEVITLDDWVSTNHGDGSVSSKEYEFLASGKSTLSFEWSVSSESGYDKLAVTLDGNVLLEKSGEDSGTYSGEILPGNHVLVAQYSKDGSSSNGQDQAMLSNIKVNVAEVIEVDGVLYVQTSANTACVVGLSDTTKTEIVLAETIVSNEVSYGVNEVSASAFSNCSNLSAITFSNGITEIKDNTFTDCKDLSKVVLPNSLTTIGSSAFKGCSSLVDITIPASVSSIGQNAFEGCVGLEVITIPENVTSIASRTFYGCTSLSTVVIPNTMTQIGSYAFYNCGGVESVTIPQKTSWIGERAFEGCGGELFVNCRIPSTWQGSSPYYKSKFTKVTIGEGVDIIGSWAFYGNELLSEVVLSSTVTTIEEYAFYETNLPAIELPAGILSIGYQALPYSMSRMTCNAPTPPVWGTSDEGGNVSLGNISIVYVPRGCGAAYRSVDPWASKVIVDGTGVAVNVTVTPGMMGEEILNHTNYLSDVNFLTLSGAINETDIANIQYSMPNLLSIDMLGLDMKSIPDGMFINRKALLSIILPDNVETIGLGAFYNCINLENIVLPEGLKRIENGVWYTYINGVYYDALGAFSNCSSLKSVSLPSTLENVGDLAFCNCTRLQEVEIKEGLTEIGIWAFEGCSSLKEITLPNSLRIISGGAFRDCRSLQEVVIPMGVSSIGYEYESAYVDWQEYGAFEGCSSLRRITLPQGLEKICQRTFYNCSSLTTVEIPEGVTFIGRDAFSNCSNLVSASLPSTLISCSTTPFSGCNRLVEVRCLALLPPVLSNGLLTLEDMGLALKRTLKVPEWTINRYKLTSGWAAFTQMEPITGWYPSSINVVGDATLSLPTAGLPANYKPEMNIVYRDSYTSMGMLPSSLHLRGNSDFSLDKFVLSTPISSEVGRSQLLNEATMTADTVALSMWISDYYNYDDYYNQQVAWHFFSFPFDVKVSDIVANCDWVIRKYDGKARANNKLESTWVTVPYDSVLHAGQGYIWACTGGEFTVPAMDNANKNLIFANARRDVPLKEYTAEMVSNSSWNLVGNPFPCYYNTNEMDYTAPITVWDTQRNTYAAYSPVDDNYVLSPFEAFFVQCPVGVSSIGFKPEGRQIIGTSSTSSTPMAAPSRTRAEETKRVVVNLTLSNELMADRTRFVINGIAKMDYELSCDAAKFMSSDAAVAQLYTVCGDEKYAINERPMGNGVVKLGTHFAADGTYTIAMESATDMPIVLVDLKTGVETNLATGDYTFQAAAGDNNRFEVRMYADETAVINATKVDVKVVAVGNVIKVYASSDANVELYNTAGSLIAIGRGANVAFDAAQGLYIVKVNGVSHKVAVAK